ncbi:gluconokinase [Williamsia sp. SKLECPSW1]
MRDPTVAACYKRGVDDAAPTDRHICVMGVSGSGKSTIASRLATRLDRSFCDADDLHPQSNVDKMAAGIPLTDEDRRPWLDSVVAWCDDQAAGGRSTVFACSALRRSYRDHLSQAQGGVLFVELAVPEDELRRRLETRSGHYMKVQMLASQLETFEDLEPDENAVTIDATQEIETTVAAAADAAQR